MKNDRHLKPGQPVEVKNHSKDEYKLGYTFVKYNKFDNYPHICVCNATGEYREWEYAELRLDQSSIKIDMEKGEEAEQTLYKKHVKYYPYLEHFIKRTENNRTMKISIDSPKTVFVKDMLSGQIGYTEDKSTIISLNKIADMHRYTQIVGGKINTLIFSEDDVINYPGNGSFLNKEIILCKGIKEIILE